MHFQMTNSDKNLMINKWGEHLYSEFSKDYMRDLKDFISLELSNKKSIYPQSSDIFNAFNLTPINKVKVVIIGQDPYHGENQAHGLSFSVLPGVKVPPSLKNIKKEITSDLGISLSESGYLEDWANQGVLLLNSVLTVEKGLPASHRNKGWEQFTDKVIDILNTQKENLVFLLWGAPAQKKGQYIDENKHLVLKAPHPSPLSAYRGFFGSRHFSQTNKYLKSHGKDPVNWAIH
jgi:uracil-DNA glycosylase